MKKENVWLATGLISFIAFLYIGLAHGFSVEWSFIFDRNQISLTASGITIMIVIMIISFGNWIYNKWRS